MSARECYWRLKNGPTQRETYARARLIAAAFGCDYTMPPDRATVILWHNGKPGGEFRLITDEEMADGEWVHADPHTENCEDKK